MASDELALDQEIQLFLAACRTASLATVDDQGRPCAANVQYVSDEGWRLYWVSGESTAHSVNLTARTEAAVTVYAHLDEPESIHGVQLRGQAQAIGGVDAERALRLYTAKYPFVAESPYRDKVLAQRFYRFTPAWMRWIDNRRGFGWKVEKDLARRD